MKQGVNLRYDARDRKFSYHKNKVGAPMPMLLPKTLGRKRETPYNQFLTYLCTAYGTAMAGQYRNRIKFSPEWQSGKVSEKVGESIAHEGADPRQAMKAACVWGHLPQNLTDVTLLAKGEDFVADWSNYPAKLDSDAIKYHPSGYMPILNEKGNRFDSICSAMYNEWLAHGDNSWPVKMATDWYPECEHERVTTLSALPASAHFYLAIDFDTFDGQDWLLIQSSEGENSFRWFSRDVVNKLFENPAALSAIFTVDDRNRGNFLNEAVLTLYYNLLNYLHDIMK